MRAHVTHTHTCASHMHAHKFTHASMLAHTHTHTCTLAYMCMCTHTHTHTHAHTHTHTCTSSLRSCLLLWVLARCVWNSSLLEVCCGEHNNVDRTGDIVLFQPPSQPARRGDGQRARTAAERRRGMLLLWLSSLSISLLHPSTPLPILSDRMALPCENFFSGNLWGGVFWEQQQTIFSFLPVTLLWVQMSNIWINVLMPILRVPDQNCVSQAC